MTLYVCYSTLGGRLHACSKAYKALRAAGYKPSVVKVYGTARIPGFPLTKGRQKVLRLSGDCRVPLLQLTDGSIIKQSKNIVRWAKVTPKKDIGNRAKKETPKTRSQHNVLP